MTDILSKWAVKVIGLGVLCAFVYGYGVQTGRNQIQAQWDAEKLEQQRELLRFQAESISKANELVANIQKDADEANKRAALSAAAAASAGSALDRLRLAVKARSAGGGVPATSAVASQCQTDTTASELFLKCAGRYTELARRSDAAYDAGKSCEAWADSVSGR